MEKKSKKKFTSFEEDLTKMQSVLEEMESSDLTLDEMIKKYREGIELAKRCKKQLDDAESEIKKISN
tara:strand:- start:78 stop:278 length:201 start_codon:yes stop_codon:yes gene_type:complete